MSATVHQLCLSRPQGEGVVGSRSQGEGSISGGYGFWGTLSSSVKALRLRKSVQWVAVLAYFVSAGSIARAGGLLALNLILRQLRRVYWVCYGRP